MQDIETKNFTDFALETVLFKGQSNLYFCYLKSEKLALALAHILKGSGAVSDHVREDLLKESAFLPKGFADLAARMVVPEQTLARLFSTLSLVRLSVLKQIINEDNGVLICSEYELVARKMSTQFPQITLQDLSVPELSNPVPVGAALLMDSTKGQLKGQSETSNKRQNSLRMDTILKIIKDNKRVSIKDISKTVRDCSEKTIQRELAGLISQGFVRKEGEKRWSMYIPA